MSIVRVAMVTDTYWPTANGVARSVETTSDALRELGVEVTVFAPGKRAFERRAHVKWIGAFESRVYPQLHLPVAPLLPHKLRRYDVVHVHTPGALGSAGLVAARTLGKPAVYTYHTRFEELLGFVAKGRLAEKAAERGAQEWHRQLLKAANAIVAPTPAIARELRDVFGVDADVVPTGIPERFYRRGPPRPVGPETRFLHLGRVSPEKGLDVVLRAFPRVRDALPGARLVVAGSGPDLARCQALAAELGLGEAVTFAGFVPDERVPQTYRDADVFVSASRFETQGLTVLEAMASGCASALAACDVFQPFADAGAAVLFDADEPADVARGMVEAAARREPLRERGRAVAEAFTVRATATRLLDLYRRLQVTSR